MKRPAVWVLSLLPILATACATHRGAGGNEYSYQQELVDRAEVTVSRMRADPQQAAINYFLKHSRGVMIFPGVIKGGLIWGAEGGNGVLLSRDESGTWSAPAFYTIGGVSWGLQAGVQETQVALVFMNEKALESALTSGLKLGADVSVAAGPTGAGAEASTQTAFKDVYYFQVTGGLYAGVSIEGSVVKARQDYNDAYYGVGASPASIVIERKHDRSGTARLKQALSATPR
jgi:lipid-binding SYLF domain-containing protein